MTFVSGIAPWADNLVCWALHDVPNRMNNYSVQVYGGGRAYRFALMHRKGLAELQVFSRAKDTGVELLILYGPRNKANDLRFVAASERSRMVARNWRKFCRAFVHVEFCTRNSRPDFVVMETVAFEGSDRARAELLQRRFQYRIEWEDWDSAFTTDFASNVRRLSVERDKIVGDAVGVVATHLANSSRPDNNRLIQPD